MNKHLDLDSYMKNYEHRKEAKKNYKLTIENIKKLKRYASKIIRYPEQAEAFEYVDKLFPKVGVKNVPIYKVSPKDMDRLGYGGVGGFIDTISKTVVVSSVMSGFAGKAAHGAVVGKADVDEVIVHELCHYCYFAEGQRSVSRGMNEEFAYGWSIGYLRQKGHSDDYIIKYNFMPYFVGCAREEATKNILAQNGISHYEYNKQSAYQRKEFSGSYGKKIFERSKEIATDKGNKLIELYSKKLQEGPALVDEDLDGNRFDILDL
jgi:hypothetical protein